MEDTQISKRIFEGRIEVWRSVWKSRKCWGNYVDKDIPSLLGSRNWRMWWLEEEHPKGQGPKLAVEPRWERWSSDLAFRKVLWMQRYFGAIGSLFIRFRLRSSVFLSLWSKFQKVQSPLALNFLHGRPSLLITKKSPFYLRVAFIYWNCKLRVCVQQCRLFVIFLDSSRCLIF